MPLKGHIINQFIKYVAGKLADNHSFQRLSLLTHEKIEGLRRAAIDEIVNPDPSQASIRRLLNKIIETGKDFLKKP